MRPFGSLAALVLILAAGATRAQSVPSVWNFGSVYVSSGQDPSNQGIVCENIGASSSFAIGSQSAVNLMSFSELDYNDDAGGFVSYQGLARLNFNSPTAGGLAFDGKHGNIAIPRVRFNSYLLTYNQTAGTLEISMIVHIGTCRLPISALYRMP